MSEAIDHKTQLAEVNRILTSLPGYKPRPALVVPFPQAIRRNHPSGDPLIAFVEEARDWPQPMQDDLLPILMANGFRTQAEQDASMKSALLRASALNRLMTGRERTEYAHRYGRPKAIRLVWWVRRWLDRGRWDG